jgi:prolyl oligopeptidase
VYFHKLNTEQAQDQLVYDLGHSTRDPYAVVTDDGRFLILVIEEGTFANGIYYRDLQGGQEVVRLLDKWDGRYEFLGNEGRTFYFMTNHAAPLARIVAIDIDQPASERWKTLIPESSEAMVGASYVGGRFLLQYLKDAHTIVRVFRADGTSAGTVDLPGTGSASGFGGRQRDRETFFSYTDFLRPPAVYHYDIGSGKVKVFRAPKVPADMSAYVTQQVFYTSKDGTRIPLFLTHRRDLKRNGNNKTLLYGYGGFDIAVTPSYSPVNVAWLESGGIYAVANIRGGGEYGKAWHEAGTLANKQNVFDDFIAAAEHLIRERYTSARHLGIHGRSNGGLLVGATLLQRPELFGAAIPEVGVLDMLRYHTASANARQWATDYGLSDDPEQFRAQIRYSPVQNVRPGACYPPTLITTSDHDDRVVPWHSFKFAAALQAAQSCANPILLRVETRAGHGAGMPTWMLIEQAADKLAFLNDRLR